jgi:hypothetical protein
MLLYGWLFRIKSAVRFLITPFLTAVPVQWCQCEQEIAGNPLSSLFMLASLRRQMVTMTAERWRYSPQMCCTISLILNGQLLQEPLTKSVFLSLPVTAYAAFSLVKDIKTLKPWKILLQNFPLRGLTFFHCSRYPSRCAEGHISLYPYYSLHALITLLTSRWNVGKHLPDYTAPHPKTQFSP